MDILSGGEQFTSGNASQRGTPPSGAANWGAPLRQQTLRPTSLTATGPRFRQPPDTRNRGQQAVNTDEGNMPQFAYVCSLTCSLSTPSSCSSRSSAGQPPNPRPARRGPADLADHHRLRPAPPRPAAGRRPATALGTACPAGGSGTSTRPCPPGQRTETRQARAPTAARDRRTAAWPPPRRRQDNEERTHAQGTTRTRRLNDKLRHAVLLATRHFLYAWTLPMRRTPASDALRNCTYRFATRRRVAANRRGDPAASDLS